MNICVLNGSPRGKYSTTLHTSLYLEKRYPKHKFHYLNVGAKINALEKDPTEAIEAMQAADLILFSYECRKCRFNGSCGDMFIWKEPVNLLLKVV